MLCGYFLRPGFSQKSDVFHVRRRNFPRAILAAVTGLSRFSTYSLVFILLLVIGNNIFLL